MPFFDALPVFRKRNRSNVSSRPSMASGGISRAVRAGKSMGDPSTPLRYARDDRGNLRVAGLLWIRGRVTAPLFSYLPVH